MVYIATLLLALMVDFSPKELGLWFEAHKNYGQNDLAFADHLTVWLLVLAYIADRRSNTRRTNSTAFHHQPAFLLVGSYLA